MERWPKVDPITNRAICAKCWNGTHRKHDHLGNLVDACDGECDCVHLSEAHWAAIERKNQRTAKKERRKTARLALEDPENPLRAENPLFRPRKSGRVHA